MPHRLNAGDPVEITPQQFFTDICPKILDAQREPCAKLGGTYTVQLFGEGGGSWTLDYDNAKVTDGVADKSTFHLEMNAGDFSGMMKGTLDVEAAAKEGRIRFQGDPALFSNLAAVLQPAE